MARPPAKLRASAREIAAEYDGAEFGDSRLSDRLKVLAQSIASQPDASFPRAATSDAVLSDVTDAYEALRSNDQVVQLYTSGYLKQAQDSRDISEYAYKRGATSLLDFLDAERSNRAIQLAYRQALSSYMTALEQLKEAVGTRNLP